jgi:hypothetical protein
LRVCGICVRDGEQKDLTQRAQRMPTAESRA